MTPASAGVKEYLKHAFLYRWNLLLFLGGTVAAALSPWPSGTLPLVMAAEVAYLGGLVSLPKFRSAIDAKVYGETQQQKARPATGSEESLSGILGSLAPDSRRRFQSLRSRCLEMRSIARGAVATASTPAEDLSTPALDRLLWIFLRLLVSRQALDRFLQSTSEADIQARLDEARKKAEAPSQDERFKRSLQDSMAAQEVRLQNYRRAQANAEYVSLELDRIEAKIQALAESSVNRQDPDSLSSQIEGVTESVQSTETAIRELQQITGLVDQMQEPPAILEADMGKVIQ